MTPLFLPQMRKVWRVTRGARAHCLSFRLRWTSLLPCCLAALLLPCCCLVALLPCCCLAASLSCGLCRLLALLPEASHLPSAASGDEPPCLLRALQVFTSPRPSPTTAGALPERAWSKESSSIQRTPFYWLFDETRNAPMSDPDPSIALRGAGGRGTTAQQTSRGRSRHGSSSSQHAARHQQRNGYR